MHVAGGHRPQGRAAGDDPVTRLYQRHRPVPAIHQARAYGSRLLRPGRDRKGSKFLIFAQGRTGSSLLVDLLNRSPSVHCDEEILGRPVLLPTPWVSAHRLRHEGCTYGFKVKLYQLTIDQRIDDPGAWLTAMERSGWRVLYLWRRNLLRQVLSNVLATRSGRYHYRSAPAARAPVTIDLAETLELMGVRERMGEEERMALAGVPHEPVCYEDDLMLSERHQPTFDRLARVLGAEPAQATTELRRINSGRLSGLVDNYRELERELVGTPWEGFLD